MRRPVVLLPHLRSPTIDHCAANESKSLCGDVLLSEFASWSIIDWDNQKDERVPRTGFVVCLMFEILHFSIYLERSMNSQCALSRTLDRLKFIHHCRGDFQLLPTLSMLLWVTPLRSKCATFKRRALHIVWNVCWGNLVWCLPSMGFIILIGKVLW